MSLADALDAPVLIVVRGETIKLGVLDLDDLAAIEREAVIATRERELAKLPNTATADDVRAVAARITGLTIDGLANHVFTLPGCRAFIERALVKGGMAKVDALALYPKLARAVGLQDLSGYAAAASGIYPARVPEPEKGKTEGDDPNAPGGKAPETSALK